MMARTLGALIASGVLSLSFGTIVSAQDAVQWTVEEGGNGHWYQVVHDQGISWTAADSTSDSAGGHLATATSEDENRFLGGIATIDDAGPGWWLGARKITNADTVEGEWAWITGETWEYTSWGQAGAGSGCNQQPDGRDAIDLYCVSDDGTPMWSDDYMDWKFALGYIIEWSADCNGDGIVDHGQILDGTLTDADHNGVPDCCDDGTCYSDPIRVPQDYSTIQAALNASRSGDVILVEPGVYTGTGDEVFRLPTHVVNLIGLGEFGEVTIDGSSQRRGLTHDQGPDGVSSVIQNLHFVNCVGPAASVSRDLRFADCSFVDNSAAGGPGAVKVESAEMIFSDCIFQGNVASDYGAILLNTYSSGVFRRCTFIDNHSTGAGRGGVMLTSSSPTTFHGCVFIGNSGTYAGTGVLDFNFPYSTNYIESSLFCSNSPSDIAGDWTDVGGNIFPSPENCPEIDAGDLQSDCNEDGVPDLFEILTGAADCNENGVPDSCELIESLIAAVDRTPESFDDYIEFDLSSRPDAESDVDLEVAMIGDLAAQNQFAYVYLDDVLLGFAFVDGAISCERSSAAFIISSQEWNDAGLDGDRRIRISGVNITTDTCSESLTAIDLAYVMTVADCNDNDTWDECESDRDGDGLIDDCDGCPDDPEKTDPGACGCGTSDVDTDGDTIPDCSDPCPLWPYDCSEDGQTIFVAVGQSVQAAIDIVPAGGVVELAAGTHFGTGDRVATFTEKPLTLRGETGGDPVVIDGESSRRGLYCSDPDCSGSLVENLEIRNGDLGFAGGGAYLRTVDFTFRDCRFVGNRASGSNGEGDGGGLYALEGTVTLEQCEFQDNSALRRGGALATDLGNLVITGCSFTGNSADGDGGAVHLNESVSSLLDCAFTGNLATVGTGGGAVVRDGAVGFTECDFRENRALDGGGLACTSSADVEITSCSFEVNESTNSSSGGGGGLYVRAVNRLVIDTATFDANTADHGGGGIYAMDSTDVEISNTMITDNTMVTSVAGKNGGGILFWNGDYRLEGCALSGNTAGWGGAIYAYSNGPATDVELRSCVIIDNVAQIGGGLYSSDAPRTVIIDTTICSNTPDQIHPITGHGDDGTNCITEICDTDSDGTLDCIDGCPDDPKKIEPGACGCGNEDVDTDGDGIPDCIDPCPDWPSDCSEDGQTLTVPVGQSIQVAMDLVPDGGTVAIEAGLFTPGAPLDPQGRAMTIIGAPLDSEGRPTTVIDGQQAHGVLQCINGEGPDTGFANLLIRGGHAVDGGGMYNRGSTPVVQDCLFEDNHATTAGGGVYNLFGGPTFTDCRFTGNTSDAFGGGMYNQQGSDAILVRCTFTDNVAASYGGGLNNFFECEPILDGCVFIGNTSSLGGGIANNNACNPLLTGCTIRENTALSDGGGIHSVEASLPEIDGSIVCGNTLNQFVGGFADVGGNCIREACGTDLDGNGVPDDCDPDCDGDGEPDAWEIWSDQTTDCNENLVPDDCEIADGIVEDCNGNDIPDGCEVASGDANDVNDNGIPDSCDLSRGDLNLDGCVNGADLSQLLSLWGLPGPPIGDLDGDGTVSGSDLTILLSNWSPCP